MFLGKDHIAILTIDNQLDNLESCNARFLFLLQSKVILHLEASLFQFGKSLSLHFHMFLSKGYIAILTIDNQQQLDILECYNVHALLFRQHNYVLHF